MADSIGEWLGSKERLGEIKFDSGFAVCPQCSHTWVATIPAGEAPVCPKCLSKGELRGSS